ncbi:MAG TPA: biotin/lipoyl-containing protein [Anaerolineae bacterium]|nr:biotin/lipoyl-containing protein [Anaerolineae bacterium]
MDFQYQIGAEVVAVKCESSDKRYRITIVDRTYDVQLDHARSPEVAFTVDGARHIAQVVTDGTTRYVAIGGHVLELKKPDPRSPHRRHHHGEDSLSASMPGQVAKLLVAEGDAVERGQTLLILEAMKMEIKIAAPHAGRVAKVLVKQGQVVDRGQGLIEMSNDKLTMTNAK